MSRASLFNGGPVPDLSSHRGLHYGDGIFRTCFIYDSQVIDINEQCELAAADAGRLGLAPVPAERLSAEARQLARGQRGGVLKILLLRGGQGRGYRPEGASTDRLLSRYEAPAYRPDAWEQGVSVRRSTFTLAAQPALAGIKHLNRLEQVLASRDWEAGVDGYMRRKVLALAPALGLECRVQHGRWEELDAAEEVFLTNSLIGIWPVARLDRQRWAAPGPVTRRLMERLAHPRWAHAGRAA